MLEVGILAAINKPDMGLEIGKSKEGKSARLNPRRELNTPIVEEEGGNNNEGAKASDNVEGTADKDDITACKKTTDVDINEVKAE